MRVEPSAANAARYYRVDPAGTLGDAAAGKVVIEYLTFHVMTAKQVR